MGLVDPLTGRKFTIENGLTDRGRYVFSERFGVD
jgi:hypothetical protein